MEKLALQTFPFPYVYQGSRYPGVIVDWATACATCDRQCENAPGRELQLCSYGVNYQRFDEDLLVAGVVVRDYPDTPTPARRKRLREAGPNVITVRQLAAALARCAEGTEDLVNDLRARKNALIEQYQRSEEYKDDVVGLLRPDLEKTLAQIHDYKQFVQQIVQNLVVILEQRFPELPIEEKLAKAAHEEVAIYWAATLMDEKLDAALFLQYPERIDALHHRRRTRFHGVVTKYLKIYQRQIEAKRLKVNQVGGSYGEIEANAHAIGIIPHALIDNAVKYAPRGSRLTLHFSETDDHLEFAISSYGPKLGDAETERVFELFFRGEEAKRLHSEGTGFGLASAQNVAKVMGTRIRVTQDSEPGPSDTYLTTFAISFPLLDVRPAAGRQHTNAGSSKQGRRHR